MIQVIILILTIIVVSIFVLYVFGYIPKTNKYYIRLWEEHYDNIECVNFDDLNLLLQKLGFLSENDKNNKQKIKEAEDKLDDLMEKIKDEKKDLDKELKNIRLESLNLCLLDYNLKLKEAEQKLSSEKNKEVLTRIVDKTDDEIKTIINNDKDVASLIIEITKIYDVYDYNNSAYENYQNLRNSYSYLNEVMVVSSSSLSNNLVENFQSQQEEEEDESVITHNNNTEPAAGNAFETNGSSIINNAGEFKSGHKTPGEKSTDGNSGNNGNGNNANNKNKRGLAELLGKIVVNPNKKSQLSSDEKQESDKIISFKLEDLNFSKVQTPDSYIKKTKDDFIKTIDNFNYSLVEKIEIKKEISMIGIVLNGKINNKVHNQQLNVIKEHIKKNPLTLNITLDNGEIIEYEIYEVYKGYFIDEEGLEPEEDTIESFFF